MVYAKFGGQTECIMGNWKIENVVFAASLGMGLTKPVYPTFYMIPGPGCYVL